MKLVTLLALAPLALVACGSSPQSGSSSQSTDSNLQAAAHAAPSPYVLQWVGTYKNADASPGALETLELHRDGHYYASWAGSGYELGSYRTPKAPALPLPIRLITTGVAWGGQIAAYKDELHVTDVDGTEYTLHATAPVGPHEDACESTQGQWLDDEADPATGLFCICPAGLTYIPSQGGCVN